MPSTRESFSTTSCRAYSAAISRGERSDDAVRAAPAAASRSAQTSVTVWGSCIAAAAASASPHALERHTRGLPSTRMRSGAPVGRAGAASSGPKTSLSMPLRT